MGIAVNPVSDETLPFEDETFDIIINQHESFLPKEVYRVLKKGGIFITQQVGSSNNLHLRQYILDGLEPMAPEHDLDHCVASLKEAGFAIFHEDEVFLPVIFNDLGALANYAANVSWEFPGFSVDACFDNLLRLDDVIRERGYIEGTEHRFIVICKKLNK
jgi:SAM-dependent methyltransferase